MSDQNQSEEEKKKEEQKYNLRIDDACQQGVEHVPEKKEKKNQYSDWSWV